jgi:hypothetical protein
MLINFLQKLSSNVNNMSARLWRNLELAIKETCFSKITEQRVSSLHLVIDVTPSRILVQ